MSRRGFMALGAALLAGTQALISGCGNALRRARTPKPFPPPPQFSPAPAGKYDYIVIGSGAGGGPLACNLALAGFRVLLLEAGGDEQPCEYDVPAFHAPVSEHPDLRWDFFVRHYADETQQARDCKYVAERKGVLYPRSGTLGGCTAHNAMILVYPHNSDWDHIAELTGDESWHSGNMRKYFERMERCGYANPDEAGESRHGFDGWLSTQTADPQLLLDPVLFRLVKGVFRESMRHIEHPLRRLFLKLKTDLDPNDWRFVCKRPEGLCNPPLTTENRRRRGSREYIRQVQATCPDRLEVRLHALATRILLDDKNRAYGVEYLSGAHQYRADPHSADAPVGQRETVRAEREVILAGGAFNSPQLLKLSGIGPADELTQHGISVRQHLLGVGKNLQDRYEVAVVTRLKESIPLVHGMALQCPKPGETQPELFREWLRAGGPYTANGAAAALMKRSDSQTTAKDPDLFIFGLIGDFHGYYPGYSRDIARREDVFSWAILKAHTQNRAGTVRLRSADPRDVPDIDFHYFSEGTSNTTDLDAVVDGVESVRRIIDYCGDLIAEELLPGPHVKNRDDIKRFVQDQAWGHHASCSCKMGPANDPMAVVDNRFRVHGVKNLRVVDASVFPRIPGFFIVSAVYMIAEKASDAILEDAKAYDRRS